MTNKLSDILTSVNSYTDLEAILPTETELVTRTDYANQSVRDAADAYAFPQFKTDISITASGASVSLPSNFRYFETAPQVSLADGTYKSYPEIKPEDRFNKTSSDCYCYILGNESSGYTAVFNNLTVGNTINIVYQRFPSGFATLTDVCELPAPEYVKQSVIAYVLEARGDERAEGERAKSNALMRNMIGRFGMNRTPGGHNLTPRSFNYVIGE